MRLVPLLFIALFSIIGCRTQTVVVERVTHDTLNHTVQRVDSFYLRDSVTTFVYQKGDTVFKTRDRWRDRLKYVAVHDTLYINHTDTIPVIKETPADKDDTPTWKILLAALITALMCIGIFKVTKS